MLFSYFTLDDLLRLIKGCQRQCMWQPGTPIMFVSFRSFSAPSYATLLWIDHPKQFQKGFV